MGYSGARNYRPCFRENQPKRSFSIKWKQAFWACFLENWVYKFGHGAGGKLIHEKNRSKNSRDTVPLIIKLFLSRARMKL